MELSLKERLFLYNQYEILRHLDKDKNSMYLDFQEILKNGYKYNYVDLVEHMNTSDTDEDVSKFVFEVFEMYRLLDRSFNDLNRIDKTRVNKSELTFKGFSRNLESKYFLYSEFVLNDLDLYRDLQKEETFMKESVFPMVDTYRLRLEACRDKLTNPYSILSLAEIKALIRIDVNSHIMNIK